jgi:hypothetical protein
MITRIKTKIGQVVVGSRLILPLAQKTWRLKYISTSSIGIGANRKLTSSQASVHYTAPDTANLNHRSSRRNTAIPGSKTGPADGAGAVCPQDYCRVSNRFSINLNV